MPVVELFRALGDPTRLEMVERLSQRRPEERPHTLSSLSHGLKITRQGARKHLQILADAHIITLASKGRNTSVELDRRTLDAGRKFIAKLDQQWEKRLNRLGAFLKNNK